MITRWLKSKLAAFRGEEGTATVEFVMTAPAVIFTFLAAFESGIFMVRYVMLDRALDMTVRELRLGMIPTPALDTLKASICDRVSLVSGCEAALKLEMFSVDTSTWTFPTTTIQCIDRGGEIKPAVEPSLGVENEVMLIRACLTSDALFPTTGIATKMKQDSNGGYFITATSAFVNEP